MNIQWYPGHMTKTRRQMAEYIKQVDAVCEVVDARIPQVSRNPDMDEIAAGKPRLMILNRIDLADPKMTSEWAKHFRAQGMAVIETDRNKREAGSPSRKNKKEIPSRTPYRIRRGNR